MALNKNNKKNKSNAKTKKFVEFLDNYQSQDYSALTTIIQDHFDKNDFVDPSFSGANRSIIKPLVDISQNYTLSKDYYNIFNNSIWNMPIWSDLSNHHFLNTDDLNQISQYNNLYYSWQQQHSANILASPLPQTEITIKPTKQLQIDASINTLNDIISIIDQNEYCTDTEYNIDLKSLHNIKSELKSLQNMIGMESLKQSVLNQLIYFIQELHVGNNISDFKHTVIYGPPGTGKTEIAKIIGKMYSKLGVLKNNVFKKVTRSELIAGYLGQTAIKTKKVIDECTGGVLFIDEAYSLANADTPDSFSKECLDTLCESLSDRKNDLMVIIAGYETELNETFFKVNKGLKSRFIWNFTMEPYNANELMNIFKKLAVEQEWEFDKNYIMNERWFEDKKDYFKFFGRDMELLLTFVKISHGRRIYGKDKELRKKITLDDMNKGYEVFLKNKNTKKEPYYMNSIYV